jgi:hypothetical protein
MSWFGKDPYVISKFKLKAKIGDVEFQDVVSCSATFGLNSIPSCSLVVATGKEIRSGTFATIHTAKERLQPRDKAVVTLALETTDGFTDKMENGEFVIFDGYYAGIGYQRSFNSANYTLHLVHWLDDLNASSMLNGNWFSSAPYDLAQNAAYFALDPNEGAGTYWSTVPIIDVKGEIITAAKIKQDLWGEVLKPIFNKIAQWPSPRYQGERAGTNDAALTALARMPGRGADFYKPLALDTTGLNSKDVEYAMRAGISKDALEAFAYTTFWSKLVGDYAPQFFFAVAPCVEFALPVPFYAGLSEPYKKIYADEYGYANFNASMSRILESVDVFFSPQPETGYAIGGTTELSTSLASPLGYYPPQVVQNRKGMKLLKDPPAWMTNIVPESMYAGRSTGTTARPVGDTMAPQTGESTPPTGWLPPDKAVTEQRRSSALTRFAEHWYKTEVLSQRSGELSGKLRFDIGPGSIIAIETPPKDKTKTEWWSFYDKDAMYATVNQVSFVINAEKATAGTSFALSHIRTYEENNTATLADCQTCGGQKRPPMFTTAWAGAPLSQASTLYERFFGR